MTISSRPNQYKRVRSGPKVRVIIAATLAACLTDLWEWLVPWETDETADERIITLRRHWREDGSHDR